MGRKTKNKGGAFGTPSAATVSGQERVVEERRDDSRQESFVVLMIVTCQMRLTISSC